MSEMGENSSTASYEAEEELADKQNLHSLSVSESWIPMKRRPDSN